MAVRWITHKNPHPLKDRLVDLKLLAPSRERDLSSTEPVTVVDWFDRVNGTRLVDVFGDNRKSEASRYMQRRAGHTVILPKDDEIVVVYTKSGTKHAVHAREIQGEHYATQSQTE